MTILWLGSLHMLPYMIVTKVHSKLTEAPFRGLLVLQKVCITLSFTAVQRTRLNTAAKKAVQAYNDVEMAKYFIEFQGPTMLT